MNSLSDLTIFIPTCNRPEELERAIKYWRQTQVTIHILDGSDLALSKSEIFFSSSNIHYHHYPRLPDESQNQNYVRRMRLTALLAKSRFSAIIGDDDLFLVSGLEEALRLFDQNDKIDAVVGEVLWFKKQGAMIHWKLSYASWKGSKLASDDSAIVRIRQENPYNFYGILRTSVFVERSALAFQISFRDQYQTECLWMLLGRVLCRTAVIDNALWLRQGSLTRHWGESSGFLDSGEMVDGRSVGFTFGRQIGRAFYFRELMFSERFDVDLIEDYLENFFVKYQKPKLVNRLYKLTQIRIVKKLAKLTSDQRRILNLFLGSLRCKELKVLNEREKLNVGYHSLNEISVFFTKNSIGFDQEEFDWIEKFISEN